MSLSIIAQKTPYCTVPANQIIPKDKAHYKKSRKQPHNIRRSQYDEPDSTISVNHRSNPSSLAKKKKKRKKIYTYTELNLDETCKIISVFNHGS